MSSYEQSKKDLPQPARHVKAQVPPVSAPKIAYPGQHEVNDGQHRGIPDLLHKSPEIRNNGQRDSEPSINTPAENSGQRKTPDEAKSGYRSTYQYPGKN